MNKQHINISKAATKKKQPTSQHWGKDKVRKGLSLGVWAGLDLHSQSKFLGHQEGGQTTKRFYNGPVEG